MNKHLGNLKVLFYCQNLLGIGHLTRSLAICHELMQTFDVHFVQGGPDVGKTLNHKNFHQHFLPPLLMEESDSSLYDPSRKREVADIFEDRKAQLEKLASEKFDFCLIELYPFGRRKFRKEVFALLDFLKKSNPKIKTLSSLRDILVESQGTLKRAEEVIEVVKTHFDKILVHSDPQIFRLEETFPRVKDIEDKLLYTGFVAEDSKKLKPMPRKNQILVSLGGGSVGIELIEATLRVVRKFPQYKFLIIPGPFSPKPIVEKLKSSEPNVEWKDFLANFEEELSQSVLSISLAGYNTVMNLLNTKTYGLVYPYRANQEQEMRAKKLMTHGLLEILEEDDLKNHLAQKIEAALNKKYPKIQIQLDGALQTQKILQNLFSP